MSLATMKTKQTKPAGRSFKKSWFGIAGLVLAGALHVSADEIGPAGDEQLRLAARQAIRTNPFLGVFDDVLVDVDGGRVWLRGSVEQRHRRDVAAARIAKLPGVLEVRNEIEVQSSTPEDVMLRRRLFERLYYGGGIENSQRPEWPVRILVSDGRVTLAGDVASSAERERLKAMAWNAGARFVETRLQAQVTSMHVAPARD